MSALLYQLSVPHSPDLRLEQEEEVEEVKDPRLPEVEEVEEVEEAPEFCYL